MKVVKRPRNKKKSVATTQSQLLELSQNTLELARNVHEKLAELFQENKMLKSRIEKLETKWSNLK